MKLIIALKTGFSRSVMAWKGILIFWAVSFITVSLVVVPLKASLKAALGNSMITEKLVKGINVDVLGDLGTNLHSMMSSLSAGIIMLTLTAILLNIFITGGLFDSVKKGSGKLIHGNFFRESAKNFWPYMIITLMLYLIAIALIIILVVIPVSVTGRSESAPEGMTFSVFAVCTSVFMLFMSVIFLVADYSRAWQASHDQNAGFKALGFGFSMTFRTFLSSFPLMLIMLVLQAIIIWMLMKVIAGFVPSGEAGVILLFAVSQLLFFLKLFLKVVRYGSVTSLMEQHSSEGAPEAEKSFAANYELTGLNGFE